MFKKDCYLALTGFRCAYIIDKWQYSDFEITADLIDRLYSFASDLSKEVVPIFITKNTREMSDFEEIVRNNLEKIGTL